MRSTDGGWHLTDGGCCLTDAVWWSTASVQSRWSGSYPPALTGPVGPLRSRQTGVPHPSISGTGPCRISHDALLFRRWVQGLCADPSPDFVGVLKNVVGFGLQTAHLHWGSGNKWLYQIYFCVGSMSGDDWWMRWIVDALSAEAYGTHVQLEGG